MARVPAGDSSQAQEHAVAVRSAGFGRYLHQVRTEVFKESLREFSRRIGLSPSYIGKLENGEAGVPRRSTVVDMARRLISLPTPFSSKPDTSPT